MRPAESAGSWTSGLAVCLIWSWLPGGALSTLPTSHIRSWLSWGLNLGGRTQSGPDPRRFCLPLCSRAGSTQNGVEGGSLDTFCFLRVPPACTAQPFPGSILWPHPRREPARLCHRGKPAACRAPEGTRVSLCTPRGRVSICLHKANSPIQREETVCWALHTLYSSAARPL